MSYPGAGRPHGHHQTVGGGGGGMPQPNYGYQQQQQGPGQGYGGPPPPGYGLPPGQYAYQPSGGFPQPHSGYQEYPSQPAPQQYNAPPPMHYAPQGGPVSQQTGPSQYSGGQYTTHMQPTTNSHMYSNCSGSRKALLIGINYTGSSAALRGCHNDVQNLSAFIMQRYGYKAEDMVILMDLPTGTAREQPTRANITAAMRWLVQGAQPNDSLFFHYSGHGGQAKDTDGDEDDYDETILPLDFKTAGQMTDDELHDLMVRPLPPRCRLTAIFDSCHSGSALDLPYIYSTKGVIKEPNMLADAGSGALSALTSYARGDLGGVFKSITGVGKRLATGNSAQQKTKATKSSQADVISWSGCKDSQTSADAQISGTATGAMSHAFVASLTKYPQQNYLQLLNTVRDEISQYSQKPQLSCSHELDTSLLAIM